MAPARTLTDSPPLSTHPTKLNTNTTTDLSPSPSPLSSPTTSATSASSHPDTSHLPTAKHPPRPCNAFEDLIASLSATLGPASGLTTAGVDLDELMRQMGAYPSDEAEWGRYALGDLSRVYTRNLVDVGNGKCNLLILVWSPGKGSLIHDHADAHCLMRILSGSLRETRYSVTPETPSTTTPPQIIKETTYAAGQVTYMSDSLGVHKISNPDPEKVAVSLHLYTPPNAAREGCNVWDERTGRRHHVRQNNYYSVLGVRGGKVEELL